MKGIGICRGTPIRIPDLHCSHTPWKKDLGTNHYFMVQPEQPTNQRFLTKFAQGRPRATTSSTRRGLTRWFPTVDGRNPANQLILRISHPYHPCMVYLPTFSWIYVKFWQMNQFHGSYGPCFTGFNLGGAGLGTCLNRLTVRIMHKQSLFWLNKKTFILSCMIYCYRCCSVSEGTNKWLCIIISVKVYIYIYRQSTATKPPRSPQMVLIVREFLQNARACMLNKPQRPALSNVKGSKLTKTLIRNWTMCLSFRFFLGSMGKSPWHLWSLWTTYPVVQIWLDVFLEPRFFS